MKNQNNEDIFARINNSNAQRPESLSKESAVELIKSKGITPMQEKKTSRTIKRIASVAAALAVLLAGAIAVENIPFTRTRPSTIQPTEQTTLADEATTATLQIDDSMHKKVENHFLSLKKEIDKEEATLKEGWTVSVADGDFFFSADDMKDATITTGTVNGAAANRENVSHGETNTQVDGVDEADIIENDGTYLYTINGGSVISIVDADRMNTVSQIKIEADANAEEGTNLYVSNIYLNGDTLVVLCNSWIGANDNYKVVDGLYCCCSFYSPDRDTVVITYDVSDRSAPKEMRRFNQDGHMISSRMVGGIVYTVTEYNPDLYTKTEEEVKKDCIPTVDGERVEGVNIHWDEVGAPDAQTYAIISAFDTAQLESKVSSLAALDSASDVYCTQNTMYLTKNVYEKDRDNTKIKAFSINGTQLSFKAEGIVPGYCLNQYSMDEYNGYFRIATTAYDFSTYIDVSSVYVLDGGLNIVGKVEDLAYNEEIKSVRFMGNTAYVVTYVNTDPLFVIDLSNPTNPTVRGEVKLPGFSTYLHPVGDGLVVGVGYGEANDKGYTPVKVSLFDISNPEKPFEINNIEVEYAYTSINNDPKAFMFYAEKGLIGIPLQIHRYAPNGDYISGDTYSFMTLKVNKNGLEKYNGFVHGEDITDYFRGTYIGESVYTLSNTLIQRFDLNNFEKTGSVEIEVE